ncbi:hypothetical protein Rhopal_006237-T1 [Rhodotorula paludigena]|uniref:Phospholipid/glycerol acyltransferase domain-containing protein n=1 Tax=Rhodotorula paludigena TaxID=86838 RepID=A0AAV5GTF0_9BASI|nr:hypothetical protein Rhopal_006237-T1 [Rhodotorula paludigena]
MALPRQQPPLWALPVAQRPSRLWAALPFTAAFILLFDIGILTTFTALVLLLPLAYWRPTRLAYRCVGKKAFGGLLVLVVQLFSPTELVLTAGEGIDHDKWVEKDAEGTVSKVLLPAKGIWISNHTTLADWLYLWSFTYLSSHSPSLYIALKSSLRRIPIIGWSIKMLGFVFLERNWARDAKPFARQLRQIGEETNRGGIDEKLALLLFPEGTIVTENTRAASKRFAVKTNTSQRSPIYASDYYTLPSILLSHVPPPELHLHVRAFPLAAIPLGDLSRLRRGALDNEGSAEEKAAFERWLRERWTEKEQLLARYRAEGSFVPARASKPKTARYGNAEEDDDDDDDGRRPGEHVWPIRLRHPFVWEALAAFCFFLPFLAVFFLWQHRALALEAAKHAAAWVGLSGGAVAGTAKAAKSCGCGNMAGQAAATAAHKLAGEL